MPRLGGNGIEIPDDEVDIVAYLVSCAVGADNEGGSRFVEWKNIGDPSCIKND